MLSSLRNLVLLVKKSPLINIPSNYPRRYGGHLQEATRLIHCDSPSRTVRAYLFLLNRAKSTYTYSLGGCIFQQHFKGEDVLRPVGICPQAHEALGKPATYLTFLTYQNGR
jgi:hypothetical protein